MAHLEFTSDAATKSATVDISNAYQRGGKRCLDLFFSVILLPVLAPVIGILTILIIMTFGSPIFGHTRIGRNGKIFTCWKLRTMRPNAQNLLDEYLAHNPAAAKEWEQTQKLKNDPRVTPFGRFLRRTSLDELPQIWNVIRGEMSLVGPRPITQNELSRYGTSAPEYLATRPGVTGVWQIYGRSNGCYKERVQMDTFYCRAISVHHDLMLIVMTLFVILRTTGK
jgi:lipopolysaccharide/colanic/teichoic acid biosynthesis glycosyltransferase